MKRILLLSYVLFNSLLVLGQGEIPVDMHTGQPSIGIGIWQIQDYDILTSVSLGYSTTAIRAGQLSGDFGLGWSLAAGGSITRQVRGLPDEWKGSDSRKGWLFGGSVQASNFGSSSDLSANCPNSEETPDIDAITGLGFNIDTEPDLFHYEIGGISGDFVFDNNNTIRLIPMRDISIVPYSYAIGSMPGFTITTNDGLIYTFDRQAWLSRSIIANTTSTEYFRRDYQFYPSTLATIQYTTEWKLTSILAPSGAYTQLSYDTLLRAETYTPTNIAIRNNGHPINYSATGTFDTKTIYTVHEINQGLHLTAITASSGQSLAISYRSLTTPGSVTTISISDNRRPSASTLVKTFTLAYTAYELGRSFLASITESAGCDQKPPYTFSYFGFNSNDIDPTFSLPNGIDFWGYFNGRNNTSKFATLYIYPLLTGAERYRIQPIPGYASTTYTLNGADRTVNPTVVNNGAISAISYPGGGVATFVFESHDFYDLAAAQNNLGGGLRIKTITYFDGVNKSTLISKTFNYTESATGHSSGRLISRPSFAIPTWKYKDFSATPVVVNYGTPAGQDIWDYFTTRTETDISSQETSEGNSVVYKEVSVARAGAGSAKFEYTLPGVFGETTNGNWTATVDKFSRPSDCPTMGVVDAGSEWRYPHALNPNFDYERGLLTKKTEYNETGATVRVTSNTYQYLYKQGGSSMAIVAGLSYDKYANANENIYLFGKYFLQTDVDKALLQQTVTTYDATDITKSLTEITQYNYTSAYHKLLTSVQKTASDGVIYTSKMTYPLDYQGIPATNIDKSLTMIKNLQAAFRNGTSIEQQRTITRPSQPEKVIGASLIKFNDFVIHKILADSVFTLSVVSGITDFHPASMAVFNGITWLRPDSRFELSTKFLAYDLFQKPVSAKGMDRTVSTTLWGYNKTVPVVQATNAVAGEFAFSDFETTTGYEFAIVSGGGVGTGRTGRYAVHPVSKLSATLKKANANNYVVSFWMKKLTDPVDFNISINSTVVATLHATPGSSNFEYFEKLVPMGSITTGSSFLVEIQGQFTTGFSPPSDPSLLPMIDDVGFYPESATVASSIFTFPFGPTTVTNGGKITSSTLYDDLGRPKFYLDQDKNIIKKNTYSYTIVPLPVLIALFTNTVSYQGYSTTFTASPNPCIQGVLYEWNFGSGYVAGTAQSSFTFNSTGPQTVYLRVSHPAFGQKVYSQTIQVTLAPLGPVICAAGVIQYSNSSGVVSSTSCSAINNTSPPDWVTFAVSSVSNSYGYSLTYQWKRRNVGTLPWTNVGTNSNILAAQKVIPGEVSFETICTVSSSDGRSSDSSSIIVNIVP